MQEHYLFTIEEYTVYIIAAVTTACEHLHGLPKWVPMHLAVTAFVLD